MSLSWVGLDLTLHLIFENLDIKINWKKNNNSIEVSNYRKKDDNTICINKLYKFIDINWGNNIRFDGFEKTEKDKQS